MTHELAAVAESALGWALSDFLASCSPRPRLLGLGEPTHGDETFLQLRNALFTHLVEHEGFSAIALETDADAAAALDAYACGVGEDLDAALSAGFSHGFGAFAGNRDLLVWLRSANADRAAAEHLHCYGFDAAMELTADDYRSPERAQQRMVERTARMVTNLEVLEASVAGPILVFANNAHLRRTGSTMRLGPSEIAWDGAGAVLGRRRRRRDYAVVLTSCGDSPARGVPEAPPGTVEDVLSREPEPHLFPRARLTALLSPDLVQRPDLSPAMGLAALDPADMVDAADAVVHVVHGIRGPLLTQDDLRRLIGELPDVAIEVSGPDTGAPEIAWGDTFFTTQPDGAYDAKRQPFATIVTKAYPGFDESSRLNAEGSFALNLGVGRELFAGLLGFPPRSLGEHVDRFDPAARGVLMPHPAYGPQGWVRVIDPPAAQQVQLLALAAEAARRSRPRDD